MSPVGKLFKWGTFAYEAFLALPVIGGTFVLANAWAPLGIAFLLHAVAIIILLREGGSIIGNAVGVITSLVAWIPFIGWFMHGITALILLVEGISGSRRNTRY